jgi:hypothetical protein
MGVEDGRHVRVSAAVARALIRAMGMQAENQRRESRGEAQAHDEAAFEKLIYDEGIDWNSIVEMTR